jgi:hypothetical protein
LGITTSIRLQIWEAFREKSGVEFTTPEPQKKVTGSYLVKHSVSFPANKAILWLMALILHKVKAE